MLLATLREEIAHTARALLVDRLVTGTAGNLSVRDEHTGYRAITPTGLPYDGMTADDIVVVDGEGAVVEGRWLPTSELPMHLGCYRARADVQAVVHTHSPFATAFAACGRPIPAVHYEIAIVAAGDAIKVAPYATYGTREMGEQAIETMGADSAVLLSNHGVLAVGPTLARAYAVAQKVEYLAELYFRCLQISAPSVLSATEMARVREKMRTYGQPSRRG